MLNYFLYDVCSMVYVLFSEGIRYILYRDYELFIKNMVFNISKINIFYTKLLQACASNDYFDEKTNHYLIQITDNVPYRQEEIDKKLLWEMQQQYNIQLFIHPDEDIIPINSGSISLVFVDKERKYAIKIKRKNIEKQIEHTVHYLTILSHIISHIPYFRKVHFHTFLREKMLKLYEQLDFQKEVENMIIFRKVYNNIDYVYIPKVFSHITEQYSSIIVSEYIDNAYRIETIPEDKKEIFAKILLKYTFFGALKRYMHGDLHSGNILFTEKNGCHQIVVLDFGIIFKLSETFSRELFKFMFYHEEYTIEQLSIIFLKSLLDISPNLLENLSDDKHINHMMKYTTELTTIIKEKSEFNMVDVLNCISNVIIYIDENSLKEYGININQDYLYLNIVLVMSITTSNKLCKDNILILVNSIFKEMFEYDTFNY